MAATKRINRHRLERDLLRCARTGLNLFRTFVMQDMTPGQLKEELDPEVYERTIQRYLFLERTVAAAERKYSRLHW